MLMRGRVRTASMTDNLAKEGMAEGAAYGAWHRCGLEEALRRWIAGKR